MKPIIYTLLAFSTEIPGALLIDDFSRGPVILDTVNGTGRGSRIEAEWRNPSQDFNNLTRTLQLTFSALAQLDTSSQTLLFAATGVGSGNPDGYFSFTWRFDEPVNLLGSGNSAFRIEAFAILTQSFSPNPFSIVVNNGGSNGTRSAPITLEDGENLIPFDLFPATDFGNVESISFDGRLLDPGSTFHLSSFSVVPEPSVFAFSLFTLLTAIGQRRRR